MGLIFIFVFFSKVPDGACLLTNSDDNTLRIFNLPTELYSGNAVQGLSEMVFNNMLFLSLYEYKLYLTMTQLTLTFPQPKYTYIHIFFLFLMNKSLSRKSILVVRWSKNYCVVTALLYTFNKTFEINHNNYCLIMKT